MQDQRLETTRRTVCPHGAVNELVIKTELVGFVYKTTMTERICEECLLEYAASAILADRA